MKIGSVNLDRLAVAGVRLLSIASKFVLTLYLAKFLSLEVLGVYGLLAGAAALLPVIAGLGLSNFLAREAAVAGEGKLPAEIVIYWMILLVFYCFLSFFPIGNYMGIGSKFVIVVVVILFLEHVHTDAYFIGSISRSFVYANIINFIRSGLWPIAYMLAGVLWPQIRDLKGLLVAWVAGLLVASGGVFPLMPRLELNFHKVFYKFDEILKSAFRSRYLYMNDIINTATVYADRYIINGLLGAEKVGLYVFYWSIGNALSNIISTGVLQAGRGEMLRAISSGQMMDKIVKKLAAQASLWATIGGGASCVFLLILLPVLGKNEVSKYMGLMIPIILGLVLRVRYETIGALFYARRRDDLILTSAMFVAVASATCAFVLIKYFGISGAAVSLVMTYSIGWAVRGQQARLYPGGR